MRRSSSKGAVADMSMIPWSVPENGYLLFAADRLCTSHQVHQYGPFPTPAWFSLHFPYCLFFRNNAAWWYPCFFFFSKTTTTATSMSLFFFVILSFRQSKKEVSSIKSLFCIDSLWSPPPLNFVAIFIRWLLKHRPIGEWIMLVSLSGFTFHQSSFFFLKLWTTPKKNFEDSTNLFGRKEKEVSELLLQSKGISPWSHRNTKKPRQQHQKEHGFYQKM